MWGCADGGGVLGVCLGLRGGSKGWCECGSLFSFGGIYFVSLVISFLFFFFLFFNLDFLFLFIFCYQGLLSFSFSLRDFFTVYDATLT